MPYLYQQASFKTPISFYILFVILAGFSVNLLHFDVYYSLAVIIFIHQFLSLYFKLGNSIPIRNLIGTMFSLNFLFSPVLIYSWLNPFADDLFQMRADPETYFSYAIPAVLLFIIGLSIFPSKNDEKLNVERISAVVDKYPKLPLYLIIVGIIADLLNSSVPSELQFISGSLSHLKFAGFFLSILSGKRLNILYFFLSFGLLFIRSLTSSMFNELLNMLFFLAFFLCYRYKPSHIFKISGIIAGVLFVVFIQNVKFILRQQVTNSITDLKKLGKVVEEGKAEDAIRTKEEKVIQVIFRLNQGWFTSSTIDYFNGGGFELQNGNHSLTILQTSILPRILAPNKYTVGDATLFNKYSGHFVDTGTSMALGILSDGFIDFGFYGIMIVFVFGMIINIFIRIYHKMDNKYFIAMVFSPLCFFAVRPDTDTYASLGALIKTTFVIWLVLVYLKKFYFKEEMDLNSKVSKS